MKRIFEIVRVIFAVMGVMTLFLGVLLYLFPAEAAFTSCSVLRHSILSELDHAASVRVVEHSCRWDDPASASDPNFKETIYASVTLNPGQIESLRKALPHSLDYSATSTTANVFEDHHRIEITRQDGKTFVLRLCFHCDELEVNNEGPRLMPMGWSGGLWNFISSLGLHPDGPWKKL